MQPPIFRTVRYTRKWLPAHLILLTTTPPRSNIGLLAQQAAVVDPRRDTDIYLEIAYRQGAKITHSFETHRNEDYVTGAVDLAGRTGAAIHHGSQLDFRYGHPANDAVRGLVRIGYDNITAYLAGGLHAWETSGRRYGKIPAIHITDVEKRIDAGDRVTLLDVRSKEEFQSGHLRGAKHVYLGDLPRQIDQIADGHPVTTYCNSGQRAMIAALLLKRRGIDPVENCLGSIAACRSLGCEME